MSEYIHKAPNVSILLYHYVCQAKYIRAIFDDSVDKIIIQTCNKISKRYEINVVEIGSYTEEAKEYRLYFNVNGYEIFLEKTLPLITEWIDGNFIKNRKSND